MPPVTAVRSRGLAPATRTRRRSVPGARGNNHDAVDNDDRLDDHGGELREQEVQDLIRHAPASRRKGTRSRSRPERSPATKILYEPRTTPNLVSQAGKGAWNPALVEIAVLGCRAGDDFAAQAGKPDEPDALALAMHQLRQAPGYPAPLSLPPPLRLSGLAQAYVLPVFGEGDSAEGGESDGSGVQDAADGVTDHEADADPDADDADAAGLSAEPDPHDEPGAC
ncbi:RNaseH domain-containing protein [Streptomyces griseorubiginosus]|uniref:RNaseH domain-containing protein n=1 Tax=Streptomyces griseorubiginosus TaxID=67304 RepID=UPI0036AC11E1